MTFSPAFAPTALSQLSTGRSPSRRYEALRSRRGQQARRDPQDADESADDGTSPLPEHIRKSILKPELLVYEGSDPNIAWILQGLRHMTGIKEWQPLQQAEFLAKIEAELLARKSKREEPPGLPTIAKRAGVPPSKAGRLLNTYYALQQAREDEDYGNAPDIQQRFRVLRRGSL